MRPKKIILCVDSDEQRLSELKFMLATRGYRVLTASGIQQAPTVFASVPIVDLVIAYEDQTIQRLKRIRNYTPMILFGKDQASAADAVINGQFCSKIELMERIRIMAARKRGPRKGSPEAASCGWKRAATV